MRYLGIDPSLSGTGVAIISDTESPLLFTIKTGNLRGEIRLKYIFDELEKLISSNLIIDFAALEGYSYNSIGRYFDLGEVGGVIRLFLARRAIKFCIVAPQSLKKFITNDAMADKDKVKQAIIKEYNMQPKDDNQADASGLSKIAEYVFTKTVPTKQHQKEVLDVILSPKKKKKHIKKIIKNSL